MTSIAIIKKRANTGIVTPQIIRNKNAFSDTSVLMEDSFRKFEEHHSRSLFEGSLLNSNAYSGTLFKPKQAPQSIKRQLEELSATFKIYTAQVAMHLDEAWRATLFNKLDRLFDIEYWDEEDALPKIESYQTFLRLIIYKWPINFPSLGLANNGNLVAAWTVDKNYLTFEFLPNDDIRWVVAWQVNDERERSAGVTTLFRIHDVISPYNPSQWLNPQ